MILEEFELKTSYFSTTMLFYILNEAILNRRAISEVRKISLCTSLETISSPSERTYLINGDLEHKEATKSEHISFSASILIMEAKAKEQATNRRCEKEKIHIRFNLI